MVIPPHLQNDGKTISDFLPGASVRAVGSSYSATAGKPCEMPIASYDNLIVSLKTIYDPEIPVNIYDLGLIYRVEQRLSGDVEVDMTLTAPGCPVAGTFPGQVAETLAALEGVGVVTVTLVWEPAWTKDKMSEDARIALEI